MCASYPMVVFVRHGMMHVTPLLNGELLLWPPVE